MAKVPDFGGETQGSIPNWLNITAPCYTWKNEFTLEVFENWPIKKNKLMNKTHNAVLVAPFFLQNVMLFKNSLAKYKLLDTWAFCFKISWD